MGFSHLLHPVHALTTASDPHGFCSSDPPSMALSAVKGDLHPLFFANKNRVGFHLEPVFTLFLKKNKLQKLNVMN